MMALFLRGFAVKRPNVILIEAQPVFTGFAGALLSKIKRAPYVLNVSDLWPDHLLSVGAMTETQFAYRMARKLVDTMYRGSAHIVAMSPAWATTINGYLKRDDKTSVIYNGVDLDRFRPDIDAIAFRKKYDLGDERLITFIGTFSTQYDIDVMFRAVGQLPEYSVVIIGSGTQGERVDQYNLPNVRRINWVSHDEVPQAWAASRLTFWALRDETLYEGTIPAKLFELMACGVPVVCAIRGVTAQMIESADAGLVVDCGDVDGLAEAMRRMMTDDDLHDRCARSAREYAIAHFDPEKVADAYAAVLQASTNIG
jgi:glycosyltransferase involved in cell wall biosynthesis